MSKRYELLDFLILLNRPGLAAELKRNWQCLRRIELDSRLGTGHEYQDISVVFDSETISHS